MRDAARSRGFALVELMTVVAIVGILSTVAVPSFMRMSIRSKTAERPIVMAALLRSVEDLYRRNGSVTLAAGLNPAAPGTLKQVMTHGGDWDMIFSTVQIEGAVYYGYTVTAWEGATPGATITATGDLDGDGVPSFKSITYDRVNGMYVIHQPGGEVPPAGFEDTGTF
jgi:type IV pilus assembly protein PilA